MHTHSHLCVSKCSSSSYRFPTGTKLPIQSITQVHFTGEGSSQLKNKDLPAGSGEKEKELGLLIFFKIMFPEKG